MTHRIRIEIPHRGHGGMLEIEFESEGNWIDVEEWKPNVFTVVDNNMTVKNGNWVVDQTSLGFTQWDEEVEDFDHYSDESQCFGMSNHLRWQDVELTPYKFRAPSAERLKEALTHVTMCAWCPGDM